MKWFLSCSCLLVGVALAFAPAPPAQAAAWVVNDAADPLPITGTMTLRQALIAANAMPGQQHHIMFNIPGPGVQLISVASQLPAIVVDSVWIHGYSQPGASPGTSPPATSTILVHIDGSLAGMAHGLIVASSFNTIEGVAITGFQWDGIRIQGTALPGTRSNLVYGNFVGMVPPGVMWGGNGWNAMGNIWAGVDILCTPGPITVCTGNRVVRNLISSNLRCGVQISSCPPSDCGNNQVLQNRIGTDVGGMVAAGNLGSGVVLAEGTHDNLVQGNVISANGGNGVDITGNDLTQPPASTIHNTVAANLIGLAIDGVTPMGNSARGVSVGIFEKQSYFAGYCSENVFTTNTIAHNGMAGWMVWENPANSANADRVTFLRNRTWANGALGADLGDNGVTFNDPGDLDTGPNEELNTPMVLTADWSAGVTTIRGFGAVGVEVHVFRAALDASGFGEGDLWLAQTLPNALGNWVATTNSLVPGDLVTVQGMDWASPTYSNTSEFSACVNVTAQVGVGDEVAPRFALTVDGANPFRAATSFRYQLLSPGPVNLGVYDPAGKRVRTLVSGSAAARVGSARWDGRDDAGRTVPAGVYFAELRAGAEQVARRVVKLR